ncbi:MAG TPA: dihydroorotate dehydrogenase-like protein [Kiritimatiellia bacterium]|nr:dihydroorotate dehydrogenase-like protein [Kiritimatiellia bacterium]HMO99980.1 dihydroorotate dehydrogenase-like protein [Kiritimatiellia bacterium]HMP96923.1 dihydroorotate dehydrogenase-like protein [Kiritimatiellia bacterium]
MNLSTTYLGLPLKNPIVPSASPISENVDNIRRLADAGAAAVTMFSIFEEQLRMEAAALDHYTSAGDNIYAESTSFFPPVEDYHVAPTRYLDIIHRASEAVDIPIIGSLNGMTNEGWIDYASQIEQAGAKALELNIFMLPTDIRVSGAQVEDAYLDIVKAVKETVTIPVVVKMNPFFSSIANMAKRFEEAGADGLVLFNRFIQPDIDLDELEVVPNLTLSTPGEIRLPLRWIAILHGRLGISLAASRGVHSAKEVVKYVLAGADVVCTTSALLKQGIPYLNRMLTDLVAWMEEHEYESIEQMKGAMSQKSVSDPSAFERANYIKTIEHFKRHHAASMPW